MKKKKLLIFGKISTGAEIYEIVTSHYSNDYDSIEMILFNDNFIEEFDLKEKLDNPAYTLNYIIGFSDYQQRVKCVNTMNTFSNTKAVSIINPTAYIAKSAKIGDGCYIGANATISTNAVIKNHASINLNVSIGHDAVINEHVLILPGVRISGHVNVGEGTLIGANAFVHQKVTIGKENLIDALTYVRNDLPDRMVSSSRSAKPFKRLF